MPTPDRTSLDAIVTAARDLLEAEGLAALTMNAVAARVGVRAPSLYKRVDNRDRLIQLVAEATLLDMSSRLTPQQDVRQIADAFRAYGHERPAAFQLILAPAPGTPVADPHYRDAVTHDILRAAGDLAGPDEALEAARLVVAWASGFVTMELNGAFQLGGDVDAAWSYGVERIVAAITR